MIALTFTRTTSCSNTEMDKIRPDYTASSSDFYDCFDPVDDTISLLVWDIFIGRLQRLFCLRSRIPKTAAIRVVNRRTPTRRRTATGIHNFARR